MKYVFLGGAGEVGASCLLILTADRNILIDCGIRVNQRGPDALPDLDLLKGLGQKLDAIFHLTRACRSHRCAPPGASDVPSDTNLLNRTDRFFHTDHAE